MSEKIAVVTGASSGIGWELARQLARRAYTLWLVARREERLRELSELLAREAGAGAETLALDLSDPAGRRKLAQRMESVGGALSLVVNNAGFGLVGPTAHWPFNRYEEMIRLNITALTEISWEAVRIMMPRRSGGLINVASTAAFQSVPYMNVYSATKAYVLSFTEALAEELRGSGVRVMALCPGYTRTEFQKLAGGRTHDPRLRYAMDPATCARSALRDYERGKTISVPGALNRLQVFASWLMPRRLVTAAAAQFMMRRSTGAAEPPRDG